MIEAYACVPCSVLTQKLSKDAIATICSGLARPQKTRPKQRQQLSPRSKRRQEDALFKPPVPYASNTVEVKTMDAKSEHEYYENIDCIQYRFKKNDSFGLFSAHALVVQINKEHNYF